DRQQIVDLKLPLRDVHDGFYRFAKNALTASARAPSLSARALVMTKNLPSAFTSIMIDPSVRVVSEYLFSPSIFVPIAYSSLLYLASACSPPLVTEIRFR